MDAKPQAASTRSPDAVQRAMWSQVILAGVLALAFLLAAWLGGSSAGREGVLAAVAALAICWLPNALALLLVALFPDPEQSVSAALGGMLLRMGVPLFAAMTLLQSGHWLVAVGVLPMILGFYLIALLVETLLSLWIVRTPRTSGVKAS